MRKYRFWLIPVAIIAFLGAAILALPGYVASNTHRQAIEALASSLTGRQVSIKGDLSLGLFPSPQFIAKRITITGQHREVITARSLTLDISLPSLLHGQLSARDMTLESPVIAFPWPLPGGAASIAPPSWLAALHAEIHDGTVTIGAETFHGVEASIFTGADGAVTISGTGGLLGQSVKLSLSLGGALLNGTTPLTIDAQAGTARLHFSGSLDDESVVSGQIGIATPKISGTAMILANANDLQISGIQAKSGSGVLTGGGRIDFGAPDLALTLNATDPDLTSMKNLLGGFSAMPVSVTLNADRAKLWGTIIPSLRVAFDNSPAGLKVEQFKADLAGNGTVSAAFDVSPSGMITGSASAQSADLETSLSSFGIAAPGNLIDGHVSASLGGTVSAIGLNGVTGAIGGDPVSGRLVVRGRDVAGSLHFADINIPLMAAWLRTAPDTGITASGEITADRASLGGLNLKSLLLDADYNGALNLRRVSAALDHGMVSGSLFMDHAGDVTSVQGYLALPSAAILAALLPASITPPPVVLQARLNLVVAASGPPTALATSAVATLGTYTVTAAPVIDAATRTAIGPLSLRNPNAILALNQFGLNRGLDWPGAGSMSLRATMEVSPHATGFSDFVLSLGRTVATGRLLRHDGSIGGTIDAETLALPPLLATLHLPWAAIGQAQGQIKVNAGTLIYPGWPSIQNLNAKVTLRPQMAKVTIIQAGLAGGEMSGEVSATTNISKPPEISVLLDALKLNAALIDLPTSFPLTMPGGTINAKLSLTASGYDPRTWLATLGGTASLNSKTGTLRGFSLMGAKKSLSTPDRARRLWAALSSGESEFTEISLNGVIAHGNCTISNAKLLGPDGIAQATGSIDLYDQSLALYLTLSPSVRPPIDLKEVILGSWQYARKYPKLGNALAWRPAG
ncbi:MAG: AsmA-like C-terminal region-containing protein [Acidocella sp.]|nr:AsmA-like C-terminal region-containing protein [Acidocella sp.]